MDIKNNITINLSEDDVKKIIADYCTRNGYEITAEDVSLKTSVRLVGYGLGEYEESYFAGAVVSVKEN